MNMTRPCPSCGGTMTRGVQPETITLEGHSLTYQQPGWHCADCGDGIIQGADNEVADVALRELKAIVGGAYISPLIIRAAREAVGLSQREAGKVFGGGPNAFHQYETGQSKPTQGMATLLRLALQHPDLFRPKEEDALTDMQLIQRAAIPAALQDIIHSIYPDMSA